MRLTLGRGEPDGRLVTVTLNASVELRNATRDLYEPWSQPTSPSCVISKILPPISDSMPEVGLLGVASFQNCLGFGDAVGAAVRSFKAAGVAGVIVDLRGNTGGSDGHVLELLEAFTGEAFTYKTVALAARPPQHHIASPADAADRFPGPVVVLVNRKVMANGEIAAFALSSGPAGAAVVGFEGTQGSVSPAGNVYDLPCFRFGYTSAQLWRDARRGAVLLEGNLTSTGERIGGTVPTILVERSRENVAAWLAWRNDSSQKDPVLEAARATFTEATSHLCPSSLRSNSTSRPSNVDGCCYAVTLVNGTATYTDQEDVIAKNGDVSCACSKRFDKGVACWQSVYGVSSANIVAIVVGCTAPLLFIVVVLLVCYAPCVVPRPAAGSPKTSPQKPKDSPPKDSQQSDEVVVSQLRRNSSPLSTRTPSLRSSPLGMRSSPLGMRPPPAALVRGQTMPTSLHSTTGLCSAAAQLRRSPLGVRAPQMPTSPSSLRAAAAAAAARASPSAFRAAAALRSADSSAMRAPTALRASQFRAIPREVSPMDALSQPPRPRPERRATTGSPTDTLSQPPRPRLERRATFAGLPPSPSAYAA